uniref:Uncharacterized protein n=4 Tax=Ditylum brightwellii TaxID=49249 RepID=A0A7S4S3B8_9STRA
MIDTPSPSQTASGTEKGDNNSKGRDRATNLSNTTNNANSNNNNGQDPQSAPQKEEVKELLLCLRPLRDGEEKVGEELRFIPVAKRAKLGEHATAVLSSSEGNTPATSPIPPAAVSSSNIGGASVRPAMTTSMGHESANEGPSAESCPGSPGNFPMKKRPMKKRAYYSNGGDNNNNINTESHHHSHRQQQHHVHKKSRVTPPSSESMGPEHPTDTEKSVVESLMLMSNHAK